jgi:hypothetical protein
MALLPALRVAPRPAWLGLALLAAAACPPALLWWPWPLALMLLAPAVVPALRPALPPGLALGLVALCALRGLGLWHCETGCQGGGHYHALGGLPVEWLGAGAYALLAALALRDLLARGRSAWTVRLAWLLLGGSAFFYLVMRQLGLTCWHCLAVHFSMLALVGALCPPWAGLRWWDCLRWAALGFLTLNFAFHHQAVGDGPALAPTTTGSAPAMAGSQGSLRDAPAYRAIGAAARLGPEAAPYELELVVDLHCQVCARLHGPILTALRPLTQGAEARLAVVTRHLARASDPSSADLVAHLLAAAIMGPEHYRALLATVLGAPEGSDFAALASRIAEVEDPAAITATLDANGPVVGLAMSDAGALLTRLQATGATPQLILTAADGRVLQRWRGEVEPAEIAKAVAQAIAAPP